MIARSVTEHVIAVAKAHGAGGMIQATGDQVDDATHLKIWEQAIAQTSRDLPVHYARACDVDGYGLLGLACKTAPDLRTAIDRMLTFVHIVASSVQARLDGHTLVVQRDGNPGLGRMAAIESTLGEIWVTIGQMTVEPVALTRVELAHPPYVEATVHIAALQQPISRLVFVGHGTGPGAATSAPGSFAFHSIGPAGTLRRANQLFAPTPQSTTDSDAFWDALGEQVASSGEVEIQFSSCWTGGDQAFMRAVQQRVTAGVRQRGGLANVTLKGFSKFYAIAIGGTRANARTSSRELETNPGSTFQGTTQVNQGSTRFARPSVTYP